ncbi:MAG: hypothetical protein MJ252_22185, partial [archaeon]|nr:hypothetical protein [archaeon]
MRPKTNFRECTLHVSNIPNETTDGDLSFLFREYIVTKLALIDKNQKKFARVTFTSPEMANNVKNNLTGICFLPWSSLTGQMTCLSISKVEEKRDGYFEDETNKNILVKNLPDEMTGRKFYLFMSQFGELKTIKFKLDNFWKNVGYAEAYYSSKEAARKSLETINRKEKLSEVLGNGEFDFIKDSNMMATYMVKGMIMEDLETDTTEVKNNLYVKNIPMSYTSEDLKNYFSKYGKITSCVISTDSKGDSKGFGFVCYENPKHAAEAIIIENKIKNKFPTCNSPIYVSYAMKKEERDESLMKDNLNGDSTILFARLREDIKVTNNSEIINEVQSSVNLILGTEYSAKMIKANLEAKSALIVFQRKKDVDEFISNYTEFVKNYLPKVLFNYYRTTPGQLNSYIGDINAVANPIFMFNNLTKFDSNMKKGIKKEGQNTRGWGNEKESNKDKQPYNPANKQPYNPANKTPFNPANKPFNPANKEPYNPANKPFNPANKEPFNPANKEESNQANSGP